MLKKTIKKIINNQKKILLLSLLMQPVLAFASSESDEIFPQNIEVALFMEAFFTAHVSLFVLKPLSELISKEDSKRTFWILFVIRIVVLLICNTYIGTYTAIIDFFSIFVGGILLDGIIPALLKANNASNPQIMNTSGVELRCATCAATIGKYDKVCPNCGAKLDKDNIVYNNY